MDDDEIMDAATRNFGEFLQYALLIEEMAELQLAITRIFTGGKDKEFFNVIGSLSSNIVQFSKVLRLNYAERMATVKVNKDNLSQVSEEIADVTIVLKQVMKILGNEDDVEAIRKKKMTRLEERLSNFESNPGL